MVKNKRLYKKWLIEELGDGASRDPAMLVSAHGDVIAEPGLRDRLRGIVEKRI
jgi:hypothetical protein